MKTEIIVAVLIAATPAAAQSQHGPYAGQESRAIKALSAEEATQYEAGAGMGYARAAELNHYPGPMHVLELADKLALTPEQRASTERLRTEHKKEAQSIGRKLVRAERELDGLFASGKVSEAALAHHVRAVASLQGEYRLSHLETHRRMHEFLSPQQVRLYDELRGYAGGQATAPAKHDKQHH
jgi:Spy/CpxP family protein refolding chaperone